MRASGDPYFSHPIEVAGILTDLKLDDETIVTAILHDTIEDTVATPEQIEKLFGANVARLVDGVTKLSKIEAQSENERAAENLRKFLLALSDDIRVLLVKLADRLHNMSLNSRKKWKPSGIPAPTRKTMKDRNVHPLLERRFNAETVWSGNVFKVDAAEARLKQSNGVDKGVGVLGRDFQVDGIHIGEALEEHRLAFHHRLRRKRAEIAEAKDGGAVGNDGDQIALGG